MRVCHRVDAGCSRVVNASQGPSLMRSPLREVITSRSTSSREVITSRSTSSHASSSHTTHVTVLICANSSIFLIISVLLICEGLTYRRSPPLRRQALDFVVLDAHTLAYM
ncbi:hypothetical protein ACLB2K_059716 [Fragaria x ananassa]